VCIIVEELIGIDRSDEPVTVGIPFPAGILPEGGMVFLLDDKDNHLPLQRETLAYWPDRSIKWLLLDFTASCPAHSVTRYFLRYSSDMTEPQKYHNDLEGIQIKEAESHISVDTGRAVFVLDRKRYKPFHSVFIDGIDVIDSNRSVVVLKDGKGVDHYPIINEMYVETRGYLRSTIKASGILTTEKGGYFLDFFSRLSFYRGKGLVRIDITLRNPRAARHPGGLWDLGDEGSVYFKDFSLCFFMTNGKDSSIHWKSTREQRLNSTTDQRLEIYQDSSGGKHWDSPNHVNRYGKVMNSFKGYRIRTNEVIEEGLRATPVVALISGDKAISATIKHFWQNFPKAIEAERGSLRLRLFPYQYNDLFELQGGEQKTHTVFVQFGSSDNSIDDHTCLEKVHYPLIARTTPEWYMETLALGYMAPATSDRNPDYQALINNAINGERSFFLLREESDEYGWRHFGDIYANHEIVSYKGDSPVFVSHYNNQYDVIYGCILQFARTGNPKWFEIMSDLARHVMDIDIYHTKEDRPGFNGGQFWHTDHFMHAETSTHRAFSKKNKAISGMKSYGGGLSPEHCYTTGLATYYCLTGERMAKEAVLEVADWIMNSDRVERNIVGLLRKIKKTVASVMNEFSNAPGRAQGNSINTLLDAFILTYDRGYLTRAEEIIRRFIGPDDDIDRLNTQQIELRWFYLIFLQALGRYLDIKNSMNERDEMFCYARESLIHHAKWKSAVFDYAAKYSEGNLKKAFQGKAEYFYNKSIEDLLSFNDESVTFVRPLAILMNYGVMHTYFQYLGYNFKKGNLRNEEGICNRS
jgi:hypothetical protein